MLRIGLFLLESAFSGVFLWLGLYLITRDNLSHRTAARRWWQSSASSAGIALICVAAYLLGVAMQVVLDDPMKVVLWTRLTWWATPLACPAIFWSVVLVTTHEERSPGTQMVGRITVLLLLASALYVAASGVMTDLFFQFDAVRQVPRPPYYLEIPPRFPFYALFIALVVGTLLVATLVLFKRYFAVAKEARRQFQWLGIAMALQAIGAAIGFVGYSFPHLDLPPELGDALLTAGLFSMGYGVARYNALFQHQTITRDFYRSLAGVVVTSVLFVLVFNGVHGLTGSSLTPESIPLLIWLVTLTVTLRPWLNERLDHIFFPRAVIAVRRVLNRAGYQIVTAQDQHQALRDIEQQVPVTITAALMNLQLRELQESIERDVDNLFYKTNYTGDTGDDYIIRHTGLLHLTIVEDVATALMEQDKVSPAIDRDPYRLKALRQLIRNLVKDMDPGVVVGDEESVLLKKQLAWHLILQQQFLEDVPRNDVQHTIETKLNIGYGGGYQRLLQAAKKDLAKRLYMTERKARESRGWSVEDVPQANKLRVLGA